MEIRGKTLEQWKQNAEENYTNTPISVLKYITVLEEAVILLKDKPVTELNERNSVDEGEKVCKHDGGIYHYEGKWRCRLCNKRWVEY